MVKVDFQMTDDMVDALIIKHLKDKYIDTYNQRVVNFTVVHEYQMYDIEIELEEGDND